MKWTALRRYVIPILFCASFELVLFPVRADDIKVPTLKLAMDLSDQGDHYGAAVEFRRLALGTANPKERGAYYWSSAYEYWRNKDLDATEKMLNRTENENTELNPLTLLLHTEKELAQRNWETAASYSQTLLNSPATNDLKVLAARKLAAARLRLGNIEDGPRGIGEIAREVRCRTGGFGSICGRPRQEPEDRRPNGFDSRLRLFLFR